MRRSTGYGFRGRFHNGFPLTADDVPIRSFQSRLPSPRRLSVLSRGVRKGEIGINLKFPKDKGFARDHQRSSKNSRLGSERIQTDTSN